MENEKNTITFCTEDGDEVLFHVIEETKINGVNYLLVLDDIEDEEAEALILKDMSKEMETICFRHIYHKTPTLCLLKH